jgi:hypothetical protein
MSIASVSGTLLSLLIDCSNFWFGVFFFKCIFFFFKINLLILGKINIQTEEDLIQAQLMKALEVNNYLRELSSLFMNLLRIVEPAKLQSIFHRIKLMYLITGRVLSDTLRDEEWPILSDILLFLLPTHVDCDTVIAKLQAMRLGVLYLC